MLPDGTFEMVPTAKLGVDDVIELRAGERLPADGVVVYGDSSLDMASLTGGSVPVDVHENDAVLAGAVNIAGLMRLNSLMILPPVTHSAPEAGTTRPAPVPTRMGRPLNRLVLGSIRTTSAGPCVAATSPARMVKASSTSG